MSDSSDPSPVRLSDLFVNVVPIAIILVFVLLFTVLSPLDSDGGDPLVVFHTALIAGVVLVSVAAGWVIHREDAPLQGSAARDSPVQSGSSTRPGHDDETSTHDGDETSTRDGDHQK